MQEREKQQKKRLSKTTRAQYEHLLNFAEANKKIITGKTKPLEVNLITKLWANFTQEINSLGIGPLKTTDQWKKIFTEWRTNTRRKSREIMQSRSKTGGGAGPKKKLTDLEERLIGLLSDIHLGDKSLPDELGLPVNKQNQDELHVQPEFVEIMEDATDPAQVELIFDDEQAQMLEGLLPDADISPVTPSAHVPQEVHQAKTKKLKISDEDKTPRAHRNRYTTNILASATESFNNAQETQSKAMSDVASAINNLSTAIENRSTVLDKMASIEKEKIEGLATLAEAKLINANAKFLLARVEMLKLNI